MVSVTNALLFCGFLAVYFIVDRLIHDLREGE